MSPRLRISDSSISFDTDDDLEIFETFKNLKSDQIEIVLDVINKARFPAENRSRKELLNLINDRLNLDAASHKTIEKLLLLLLFFVRFADDYQEFKTVIENRIDAQQDPETKLTATNFFNSLAFVEAYFKEKRLQEYKTKANDYYVGLSYACNLRGRFGQDYEYESTPIEKYNPQFVDFVPIVSLQFTLQDGEGQTKVSFQTDDEKLDKMIATLLAAQKELKLLVEKVERAST